MRRTSVFLRRSRSQCRARPSNAAQVQYFTLPSGAGPHDVAVAADGTVWYTGAARRQSRPPRPENRKGRRYPARQGLGAAWRHHRARRRGLGDRQRIERQCARRPADQGGQGLPPSGRIRQCQSQYRRRSTKKAFTGSPARTASMAASIRRPERPTPGNRRKDADPTASRPRHPATSGTSRSPAIISPRSIP